MQLRLERLDFTGATGCHIHHRLFADRLALLRQVADHRPLVALDYTGIRRVLLQDDIEERRLTRAIGPD
jgi:hypothetical protein